MASIAGLRDRLPLVVFVFLVILLLMLLGFACACFSDHPMQAIERALGQVSQAALLLSQAWPPVAFVLIGATVVAWAGREARARPSPAQLQRFLF